MSKYMQSSYKFLELYANTTNKRERLYLIKNAKKDNILAIIEIVLNTLTGIIKVDSNIIQKLYTHKHLYRKLVRYNSLNWKQARQIISTPRNEVAIHKLIKLTLHILI